MPGDPGSATSRGWLWIFLLALAVRLLFVFVAANNGTDAVSRLDYASQWLQHPARLPDASAKDAWLPLHFWLLGAFLWFWRSELGARLFTVLFGALTILPYWGTVRRAFNRRVALASTFLFALFGFHVAYSVTTSVEAPTVFFLVSGVYCWVRFYLEARWKWCIFAAVAISAACLCRFDPWVTIPVLAVLLLDFSRGGASVWSDRRVWWRMVCFSLAASAGAVGWMTFSYVRWGDPMELPHRTMRLIQSSLPVLRHSLPFRLAVVPLSLLTSLSPLIIVLAVVGVLWVLRQGEPVTRRIAVLALVLFATNYFNAAKNETTQARYTLVYSWSLIPFAFEGLRRLARQWPWSDSRNAYAVTIVFFLLWQAGIIIGGRYAPATVADRLGPMSPTLLPHVEIRQLSRWLRDHASNSGALVFDDFNFEAGGIIQFAAIDPSRVFQVRAPADSDRGLLSQEVQSFMRSRHPRFVICSPYGPIGTMWSLDDHENLELPAAGLSMSLQWRGPHWRVYQINYPPDGGAEETHPVRVAHRPVSTPFVARRMASISAPRSLPSVPTFR